MPGLAFRGFRDVKLCLAPTLEDKTRRSATRPIRQAIVYWICTVAATEGTPFVFRMNSM